MWFGPDFNFHFSRVPICDFCPDSYFENRIFETGPSRENKLLQTLFPTMDSA